MILGTRLRYGLGCTLLLSVGIAQAQAPVTGPGAAPASVEDRLDRIERQLAGQGLLDMLQQLQQLQRDISLLRGEIETQNHNLDILTRRQRDLYTDMDQRLQRLERGIAGTDTGVLSLDPAAAALTGDGSEPPLETLNALSDGGMSTGMASSDNPLQVEIIGGMEPLTPPPAATPMEPVPAETESAAAMANMEEMDAAIDAAPASVGLMTEQPVESNTAAAVPEGPADPVQLQAEYQQAFNLLRQSLYDQAIRAFGEFLVRHPNDLFSDNAQYWLAEAWYVKRDYEQALTEYRKVTENFPDSQKVNDAHLKIGFTLFELGRVDEARAQLQDLITRQPDSTVARLADERLKLIEAASRGEPAAR